MSDYATYSHVQARRPTFSLTASTQPSTTQVEGWIDGADAMLEAALRAAGVTVPVTGADGILIMREWICDYAEGRLLRALANAAGDGSNDSGRPELERFANLLIDIEANAGKYQLMLTGSGPSSGSSSELRSYVINNSLVGDSKTVADGDFDPFVDRDESWT